MGTGGFSPGGKLHNSSHCYTISLWGYIKEEGRHLPPRTLEEQLTRTVAALDKFKSVVTLEEEQTGSYTIGISLIG
jgi:hypothetical protein